MLSALGYTVRDAPDGFSALNAIRDEIPDILVSDLNLPGMSGFELLSVVRRRFPAVRVIAMSGSFSESGVPPGVAADAFYDKGTRPFLLLRTVEAIMGPPGSVLIHHPRAAAPIWIPSNGDNTSGEPYVLISCPECLRAFPQILDKSSTARLETRCVYCRSAIDYVIVHAVDSMPAQNFSEGRHRLRGSQLQARP